MQQADRRASTGNAARRQPLSDHARIRAVAFDPLTALSDSWTLWNSVAGSAENGTRWRKPGCGAYRPQETHGLRGAPMRVCPPCAGAQMTALPAA